MQKPSPHLRKLQPRSRKQSLEDKLRAEAMSTHVEEFVFASEDRMKFPAQNQRGSSDLPLDNECAYIHKAVVEKRSIQSRTTLAIGLAITWIQLQLRFGSFWHTLVTIVIMMRYVMVSMCKKSRGWPHRSSDVNGILPNSIMQSARSKNKLTGRRAICRSKHLGQRLVVRRDS